MKAGTQTDTRTPMFLAVPFTVVKKGKQPTCPATDKWIGKNITQS